MRCKLIESVERFCDLSSGQRYLKEVAKSRLSQSLSVRDFIVNNFIIFISCSSECKSTYHMHKQDDLVIPQEWHESSYLVLVLKMQGKDHWDTRYFSVLLPMGHLVDQIEGLLDKERKLSSEDSTCRH